MNSRKVVALAPYRLSRQLVASLGAYCEVRRGEDSARIEVVLKLRPGTHLGSAALEACDFALVGAKSGPIAARLIRAVPFFGNPLRVELEATAELKESDGIRSVEVSGRGRGAPRRVLPNALFLLAEFTGQGG